MIGNTTRHNWDAIKSEYISGASYGDLSRRHGLNKGVIFRRSQKENWDGLRQRARNAIETKTVNAMANNAVKLQDIRREAIEYAGLAIKCMKDAGNNGAVRIRKQSRDKETGETTTVEYDFMAIVSALEKLSDSLLAKEEKAERVANNRNEIMLSYADIFSRPAPERTIEEIEAMPSDGDKDNV